MSQTCQERNAPRTNSSLKAGIAHPQGDEISGRPSESPTYCSTPAAANFRALSRPHLVRVYELGRVGTLRSAHLPAPILRRYAPVQREELTSPRTSSFGLKQPESSPCGNR